MRFLTLTLLAVLCAAIAPAEVFETTPTDQIERGRYLANYASMCVQCHSPHDRTGDLIEGQHFTGNAIPFASPFPDGPVKWAPRAPALIRLPGWSEEDFVYLLMNGKRPNGSRPMGPMPQFRLSRADASAIAAYLKSL
ncbi:MAG: c-type cytochrome [Acidobacteria bacterium]|nr:c-type cytochrome [Acidobacteriota bacterium]